MGKSEWSLLKFGFILSSIMVVVVVVGLLLGIITPVVFWVASSFAVAAPVLTRTAGYVVARGWME